MKYIIPIIILVAGFFAYQYWTSDTQYVANPIVNESLQIQEEAENYSIDINVASTGFNKLDAAIALENEIDVVEFKLQARASSTDVTSSAKYELQKGSEEYQSSDTLALKTLVVTEYQYTGGAHGNTDFTTYTYSTETGLQYDLDNTVSKSPELNSFLTDKTIAAVKEKVSDADEQWIRDGVADWSNLENFYIQDDTVHFIFAPYVVGPYAMGAQRVSVSMQELLPYARGSIQTKYGFSKNTSTSSQDSNTEL